MSKRSTTSTAQPGDARTLSQRIRPWLLAGAMALLVARVLLPSEGGALRGDDVPFSMAWLGLALVGSAVRLRDARFEFRGGWLDLGVVLLVGWLSISGLMAVWMEAPRPALNQTWSWIAAATAFVLFRQWVVDAREIRAIVLVMLALAATLSVHGFYQRFVEFPATRAAYAANPDALLRSTGQWFPPDSAERMLFEQRLASDEPLATFALTNSLAGFLTAWLPLGLALVLGSIALPRAWRRLVVMGSLVVVALAGCLILTKSRSAYAGTLVATVMIAVAYAPRGLFGWRVWAVLGVSLAILVGAAVSVGSLDWEVLAEAPKSLSYRLQYWQASLQMVVDYPWLGCGPGNFKDFYTQYKLPTASEEISDPHNFLIEIWTTGGTPAMVILLVLIGVASEVVGWRRARQTPQPTPGADGSAALPIIAGGCCGFLLAVASGVLIGPVFDVPLSPALAIVGIGFVLGMWWCGRPWIEAGRLDAAALAIACAGLLINLLAAGGISYGGVAGSLWLLAALALTAGELDRAPRAGPRWVAPAVAVGFATLAIGCYITAYRPVITSNLLLAEARRVPALAEQHLTAAGEADPWGFEAAWLLTSMSFERWNLQDDTTAWVAFVAAEHDCLAQRPRWASAWAQRGRWYLTAHERTGLPDNARAAVSTLRRAVTLYPNNAKYWAYLALAYDALGDAAETQHAAAEAWRLHEATPHLDQKLSDELRNRLPRNTSRPNR